MDIDKLLEDFHSSFITSHELEDELFKAQLYGIFTSICLSKEMFKKNSDIQPFVKMIFLELTDYEFDKKYLFQTRTNVVAKGIRTIQKLNPNQLREFSNNLLYFSKEKKLNETNENTSITKKTSPDNSFFDYWSKGIENLKIDGGQID